MAIWSNSEQVSYYHRKDPNYFEPIPDIPRFNQSLRDVLKEQFTIDDLIKKDILKIQKRSLKNIVRDMEDEVLAHSGKEVLSLFLLNYLMNYKTLENLPKL